jgi:hypothetical protein
MKNDCIELSNEYKFFENLIIDVLLRRAVLKKFEEKIKKTNLTINNGIISLIWYGYVISQLSDCRKFFDKDNNAHNFKFVARHVKSVTLQKEHHRLFKFWKESGLENFINKYLLHADKSAGSLDNKALPKDIDKFINQLEIYFNKIGQELISDYSGVSNQHYKSYLQESSEGAEIFFKEIKKI